jgi:3-hydroxybutyryl-CoA dehydrogenase
MLDVDQSRIDAGLASIAKSLDRFIRKETITPDEKERALSLIRGATDYALVKDADLAVEAATENETLKYEIFRRLDATLGEGAILATNTSSISVTRIAAVTQRPDRVIGMHFMNPVPLMKLVEIVRGLATSEETFSTVNATAEALGKTTVVSTDFPGFIVNRVLMPMLNEAFHALHQGVASVRDIDVAMKLGTNHPMGPLLLADFIGLDTVLAILNVMHDGLGEQYRPCPLLRQYVDAGFLGKKVGKGFYDYDDKGKAII